MMPGNDDPRPMDNGQMPPPPPPPVRPWTDLVTYLTDMLQRAIQPGLSTQDWFHQGRAACYFMIDLLRGLSKEEWLEAIERRCDEVQLEETTVDPEREGVTAMKVGRDVAATQRFPSGYEKYFVDREDSRIHERAYMRIVPLMRELILECKRRGILKWELQIPGLVLKARADEGEDDGDYIPSETEDDDDDDDTQETET